MEPGNEGKPDGYQKPNSPPDPKQNEDKTQDASGAHSDQIQDFPTEPHPPTTNDDISDHDDDTSDNGDDWVPPVLSTSDPTRDQGRWIKQNKADSISSWAESVVSEMQPEDVDDSSPSRLEWLRRKRELRERNHFIDQLMSMVGLEEVKAHFLAVKTRVRARVLASTHNGVEQPELRLHLVLQGSDGTGKKSIAKLYAQFLHSIGAVEDKKTARIKTLDSLLGNPGKQDWGAPNAGRCPYPSDPSGPSNPTVVFYDNSASKDRYSGWNGGYGYDYGYDHAMSGSFPGGNFNLPGGGRQADTREGWGAAEVEKLMQIAEKSVLILSSRDKSFLETLESSEAALQELPTPLVLPDYNDDELRRILVRMIQKKGLSVEGGFEDRSLSVLIRRVSQERKSKPFSNVHQLQKELDKACRRRAKRMQRDYSRHSGGIVVDGRKNILTSEDIMGPQPKDIRHDNASWEKLQNMIGLDKVKDDCGDVIDFALINHRRQLLGMEPLKTGLNRTFLGPPGVGKTTVAQIYSQILIDLGLVSGNKILLRNSTHLVGSYIGHSEEKTKKVLEEARGNVLIIDDAHMLYPGSTTGANNKTDIFRVAVLDTIVANVSADPEDRCILLLGYEHEMGQLFNNSNQGLQRRFPRETALHFETYSEDELCRIMDLKAGECGLDMTDEARAVSRQVLSRMRINPKFGNAGDVESLLNQAKVRASARARQESRGLGLVEVVLEPGDIDPQWDRFLRADENRTALFDDFVGFKKIVKKFEGYQLLVDGMRLHGIDPKPHVPWAFIFKGPPGTGKTSTARKVGRLYYDMGLLSTDEVVTCSVSDLIGEAHGTTGPKVRNTLETGLGKVLFIDEAYRLAGGTVFQMEAIGELVDAMTQPRYNKHMVVILAGYTVEMDFLLGTNPGLRSRFPEQVLFPPMNPHACFKHLKHEVQKLKVDIAEATDADHGKMKTVYALFLQLSNTTGWASGRDVETLAKTIIGNVYMKEGIAGKGSAAESLCISIFEVIKVLRAMLKQRKAAEEVEVDA